MVVSSVRAWRQAEGDGIVRKLVSFGVSIMEGDGERIGPGLASWCLFISEGRLSLGIIPNSYRLPNVIDAHFSF